MPLCAGYRHIDAARADGDEAGIGAAIHASGVPREQPFVTTKPWNPFHGRDAALRAFDGSMVRLGLDRLDLYLIHWPVPSEDRYVETWGALVELRSRGRVRSVGALHFTEGHQRRLRDETGIVPPVDRIELHPRFQQRAARAHHAAMDVAIRSWSPLGQGNVMDDPGLRRVADRQGVGVGQVILRSPLQQGSTVIPRSRTPSHIEADLAVAGFALDMAVPDGMDDADGRIGPHPDVPGAVPLPPCGRGRIVPPDWTSRSPRRNRSARGCGGMVDAGDLKSPGPGP